MGRPPRVTHQQVLTAARLTFAERGYEGSTLAVIGGRLGISPAALLRHAPNKAALFAAAMASGELDFELPTDALARLSGREDPRVVLRRLGEAFVPFLEERLGETIARWLHGRSTLRPRPGELLPHEILPFDPRQTPNPPQRALAVLETYLRRARRAGRLRIEDPRAAALAILGSLHSYVFLHRVVGILKPPLPLGRYLDSLLDIWTRGIVTPARKRRTLR